MGKTLVTLPTLSEHGKQRWEYCQHVHVNQGHMLRLYNKRKTTKQNTKVGHLDTQSQERISLPSEEKTCMKAIQSLASFIDAFIFFLEKFKILHFASDSTQLPLVLTLYP